MAGPSEDDDRESDPHAFAGDLKLLRERNVDGLKGVRGYGIGLQCMHLPRELRDKFLQLSCETGNLKQKWAEGGTDQKDVGEILRSHKPQA